MYLGIELDDEAPGFKSTQESMCSCIYLLGRADLLQLHFSGVEAGKMTQHPTRLCGGSDI
uniref:Uncharacterized protein n=1 Tax=Hyaloperonospora arabidopsidis (strain Emoy2) TaxID=559515 RepID=M4BYA8_HYAAE